LTVLRVVLTIYNEHGNLMTIEVVGERKKMIDYCGPSSKQSQISTNAIKDFPAPADGSANV
jgi:hypothetical protein